MFGLNLVQDTSISRAWGEELKNTSLWEEPASAFTSTKNTHAGILSEEPEVCSLAAWQPAPQAHLQRCGVRAGVFVLESLASQRHISPELTRPRHLHALKLFATLNTHF